MMVDWMAGLLLMVLFGGVVGMVVTVVISSRSSIIGRISRAYLLAMCLVVLSGFVIVLPFLNVFGTS